MNYSDGELERLATDVESDLAERKASFDSDAPRAVRQAICAFANDLPDRRRPGVIFVGVRDGTPAGLEINGVGIPRARRELRADNQGEPVFEVDAHRVRCTVRVRPDWPGHVSGDGL